jgi:Lipocalin-like domain
MKNTSLLIKITFAIFTFSIITSCEKSIIMADNQSIIVGKVWKITNRQENGIKIALPDCAKDDILELKSNGKYNSLIGGTQCNPAEFDVMDGMYSFSTDKKVITFTVPGFMYDGKIIEASKNQITIEFDLGPGFIIRDTFMVKK